MKKRFDDKEALRQRGLQPKIEYNKPIYYYDGSKFPFQNSKFEYMVCFHVLEHVPVEEFANFIKEIERVTRQGYIETPRLFYEYLFNFHVHCRPINFKNERLLLLDKRNVKFSNIQDMLYLMLRYRG